MNAGRKPLKQPEIIDADAMLDMPKVAKAMVQMRSDVSQDEQEITTGVFALGRLVGAAQMAGSIQTISAVAEIRAFEEINKSKHFKQIALKIGDDFRPAENIDEFCRVVFRGRGYKSMMERKVLVERLGEDMYESVSSLGLNRFQLRLLVSLPEDTRSAVEDAMHSSDKSEVITLIQSLANQLDEAKAKELELKGEVKAKEEVLARRNQKIDSLEADAHRAKTLPPDEVLNELHQEAVGALNDAIGSLRGRVKLAVIAISQHSHEHGLNSDAFLAGLCGQLQHELTIIRDTSFVKDITKTLDASPEWITDPHFKDFDPNNAVPPAH